MARKQTQSVKIKSSEKDFASSSSINASSSAALTSPAYGSKSAFVRALPLAMSAKEVIARAKSEGLTLNEAYVYNIRSVAKMRPKAPNAAPQEEAAAPKRQLLRANVGGGDNGEARMRKLIAELGLARARAVLAEVLQTFG